MSNDNRYSDSPYSDVSAFLQERLTGEDAIESDGIDTSIEIAGGTRTPTGSAVRYIGNVIDAQRLRPFNAASHDDKSIEILTRIPQANYNPGQYGDLQILPITLVANADQLCLPRPSITRVMLLIQNTLVAATINITFDNQANAGNSIQLPAGGNLLFDTIVPQNDLHISCASAGVIIVAYMNIDIAHARTQ